MERTPDQHILDDELLIIRHSGEIPEVALQGSIFFLTGDPQGPGLTLGSEELQQMKGKVVERYLEMIARDLEPENRDKGIYRGLARCIVNWQRMASFCYRENFDLDPLRADTSNSLILFIKNEKKDVGEGKSSSINCCQTTLNGFANELGIVPRELPTGWQELCREPVPSADRRE
jgi:hypothetical protein